MKAALFASALVFASIGSLAAEAAERLIAFMPIKGIVIGIPKGWKACEPFFDKKLGGAEVPMELSSAVCGGYVKHPNLKLGVFSPVAPETATIYVFQLEKSAVTSDALARITPEIMQNITASTCANWNRKGQASCIVRKDKLDNQPALVTTVVETSPGNPNDQTMTEVWEVPRESGLLQINITWAKSTEDTIARIKKSIDID